MEPAVSRTYQAGCGRIASVPDADPAADHSNVIPAVNPYCDGCAVRYRFLPRFFPARRGNAFTDAHASVWFLLRGLQTIGRKPLRRIGDLVIGEDAAGIRRERPVAFVDRCSAMIASRNCRRKLLRMRR